MNRFFKHPWILLVIIAVITIFFAFQVTHLQLDNDALKFVPKNDPEVLEFDKVKDQYGSDLIIGIALENVQGTIFSRDFLFLVKELTDKFSKIPGVADVQSLTSTDIIIGTPDGMKSVPLIGDFTGTEEEISKLKTNLVSWDIYEGQLYSKDFKATQIAVTIDPDIESTAIDSIYFSIKKELQNIDTKQIRWYVAGMPAITVLISSLMSGDISFLIPFVILVVVGILYLSFRRPGGVILPLTTVIISSIWTLGAMALTGFSLSLMGSVIPVILVAVGSAYGIHIISHYYDEIAKLEGEITREKHREVIFGTLKRIGLPVVLAGLTTLAGFGSLISSSVIPMKTFGIFTALGVLISLTVALIFIPSVLLVRHKSLKTGGGRNAIEDKTETAMKFLYSLFHKNKVRIVIATLIIAAAGIYGTTKIVKDNIIIEYFKRDTEIRQADTFLRSKFNGTSTFNIIVKGSDNAPLTNPEILKSMDELSYYLKEKYPEVSSIISITDFIKKMNQALNSETSAEDTNFKDSDIDVTGVDNNGGSSENIGFSSFFTSDSTSENTAGKEAESVPSGVSPMGNKDNLTYGDFLEILNNAYTNIQGKKVTVPALVEEINRQLNYNGSAYYEIPSDPSKYHAATKEELSDLISQYLLLYSGKLDKWINDGLEPTEGKMFVILNTPGTILPHRVALDAEEFANTHFPKGYSIKTVGESKIMYALSQLIISSQTKSILISLILVLLILSINYKSIAAGLIGIVPIGLTVLINFGVMGLFKIRLDMSTAMVSAVSIGIGIDYTIHYLSYYRYERLKTDNLEIVAYNTLNGVGKAIIFNALSVAGGFLVLLFSNFTPLNYFGLLVALTMITSSTASLTLLPIILEIAKPKFIYKEKHT